MRWVLDSFPHMSFFQRFKKQLWVNPAILWIVWIRKLLLKSLEFKINFNFVEFWVESEIVIMRSYECLFRFVITNQNSVPIKGTWVLSQVQNWTKPLIRTNSRTFRLRANLTKRGIVEIEFWITYANFNGSYILVYYDFKHLKRLLDSYTESTTWAKNHDFCFGADIMLIIFHCIRSQINQFSKK